MTLNPFVLLAILIEGQRLYGDTFKDKNAETAGVMISKWIDSGCLEFDARRGQTAVTKSRFAVAITIKVQEMETLHGELQAALTRALWARSLLVVKVGREKGRGKEALKKDCEEGDEDGKQTRRRRPKRVKRGESHPGSKRKEVPPIPTRPSSATLAACQKGGMNFTECLPERREREKKHSVRVEGRG